MKNTIQLFIDNEKKVKGYPITSPDRVIDDNGVSIKKRLQNNVKFDIVGDGEEVPEIDGKYDDTEIKKQINDISEQLDSVTKKINNIENLIFNGDFSLGLYDWKYNFINQDTFVKVKNKFIQQVCRNSVQYIIKNIDTENGKEYYFRSMVKLNSGSGFGITIRRSWGGVLLTLKPSTNKWEVLSGTFTADKLTSIVTSLDYSTQSTYEALLRNFILVPTNGLSKEVLDTHYSEKNESIIDKLNDLKTKEIDVMEFGVTEDIEDAENNTLILNKLLKSSKNLLINGLIPVNDTIEITETFEKCYLKGMNKNCGFLMVEDEKNIIKINKLANYNIEDLTLEYLNPQTNDCNAIYFNASSWWGLFKNIVIKNAYNGIGKIETATDAPVWGCTFENIFMSSIYNHAINLPQKGEGQLDNNFIDVKIINGFTDQSYTNNGSEAIIIGGQSKFDRLDLEHWKINDCLIKITDNTSYITCTHFERIKIENNNCVIFKAVNSGIDINGCDFCFWEFSSNDNVKKIGFVTLLGNTGNNVSQKNTNLLNINITKSRKWFGGKLNMLTLTSNIEKHKVPTIEVNNCLLEEKNYFYIDSEVDEKYFYKTKINGNHIALNTNFDNTNRCTIEIGETFVINGVNHTCTKNGTFGTLYNVNVTAEQWNEIVNVTSTDLLLVGEYIKLGDFKTKITEILNGTQIRVKPKPNAVITGIVTFDNPVIEVSKPDLTEFTNNISDKLEKAEQKINSIAFALPKSNGVDDTRIIQEAIDTYTHIKLSGSYKVSSLRLNKNVTITGNNNRIDYIRKIGSDNNDVIIVPVDHELILENVSIYGNKNCLGINFEESEGYKISGKFKNIEIKNCTTGLKIGSNRNMFFGDSISIEKCATGLYVGSSDNLFNRTNIGDCDYNFDLFAGGGNVFSQCNSYRAKEVGVNIRHLCYYSSFESCSIDSSAKNGVEISQTDEVVATRGHKFIACSLWGNSSSEKGVYSDFRIVGAKGVSIIGCNFFTYDVENRVKHLVNAFGGSKVNFIGNAYNISADKRPYTTSAIMDKSCVEVLDSNMSSIISDLLIHKKLDFIHSSNNVIINTAITGEASSRFQMFTDGTMKFGDGTVYPPIDIRVVNNDTIKLNRDFYMRKLGVGNTKSATQLGTVVAKYEIFNDNGVSIGFVPIYDSIT